MLSRKWTTLPPCACVCVNELLFGYLNNIYIYIIIFCFHRNNYFSLFKKYVKLVGYWGELLTLVVDDSVASSLVMKGGVIALFLCLSFLDLTKSMGWKCEVDWCVISWFVMSTKKFFQNLYFFQDLFRLFWDVDSVCFVL